MFATSQPLGNLRLVCVTSLSALVVLLTGCAKQAEAETPIGQSSRYELEAVEAEEPEEAPIEANIVEDSARDFTGYRLNDERNFDAETFITLLASADLICIGERHDNPLDHYAQLALLRGIIKRGALRGVEIGVAFEMVRHDSARSLDSLLKGEATMEEFIERANWEKEWGFPIELYAPLFLEAQEHHLQGVALGVRRTTTRAVARSGLDELDPEVKALLPELDLTQNRHKRNFYAMMGGHPADTVGDQAKMMAQYYAAQVVWDEAMAAYSAAWLAERAPVRKLVVFAGTAHCAYSAIPARTERRGDFVAVSVLPVEGGKYIDAKEAPALPGEEGEGEGEGEAPDINAFLAADYDFQLIFQ